MSSLHCSMISVIVFLSITVFIVNATPDYTGLPHGPYCANKFTAGRCCAGRRDECSVPIIGTLCYCDDFCNRTREEDCCPDYWSHCLGINFPSEPPLDEFRQCYFRGKYYTHGHTFKINCNSCKCSALGKRAEVLCEDNKCLIDDNLLEELTYEGNLGWHSGNNSEFWGKTFDDGIQYRLGTLNPSRSIHKMLPVRRIYDPDALPRQFDSRSKWPREISEISDQGWCGASWAISTVDVASDRYAIMSKGRETVKLSAQQLISCNNRGQQGCQGGYLDRAWLFIRKFGLVESRCYPWTGENDQCKFRKRRMNLVNAGCESTNPFRTELYKVGPAYRLGNETDIMQEIMTSGPVQATMKVYQDFFAYQGGIYKHSRVAEHHRSGYHSVRIIGWGEEFSGNNPPVKFWTVANSWGSRWGENGFFRIRKGTNECEIESFVLGIWAKTIVPSSNSI